MLYTHLIDRLFRFADTLRLIVMLRDPSHTGTVVMIHLWLPQHIFLLDHGFLTLVSLREHVSGRRLIRFKFVVFHLI